MKRRPAMRQDSLCGKINDDSDSKPIEHVLNRRCDEGPGVGGRSDPEEPIAKCGIKKEPWQNDRDQTEYKTGNQVPCRKWHIENEKIGRIKQRHTPAGHIVGG